MKIHDTEIDIQSAGLLLFLADNTDTKGLVKMGIREISRHIGENPTWVSRHIKALKNVNLIQSEPLQTSVTVKIKPKEVIKCYLTTNYEISENKDMLQDSDTAKFEEIWKSYRREGNKGNKASAFRNYKRLSKKDKEDMAKYIPYYMAFTLPKFRLMMPKFIKEKYWQYPREYNGRQIPLDKYFIADIDKFKDWFNNAVQGTDIPQVTEVTPERHVNLNICYTLYPKQMAEAMKIVKTGERWQRGAREGWLTFDWIFDPKNLITICESGGN